MKSTHDSQFSKLLAAFLWLYLLHLGQEVIVTVSHDVHLGYRLTTLASMLYGVWLSAVGALLRRVVRRV